MAGLTTTQTFSDGDTVTAAKLNNIISNCTIDADAVTTAKILDDNVTLGKMATGSVDTDQLVNDAVHNSKLNDMAARTVKVNATDAAANPTDIAMSNGADVAENKLLVGTTDSINAVKFNTDLELDATDSAATLIRAADTLISGKSTVTVVPANDTVLVYDADGSGNKLGKATVKDMVQSQVATTGTSGASRLATLVKSVAPNAAGIVDADVLTAKIAGPMLAKAWVEFTADTSVGAQTITNSFNLTSCTRTGVGIYDIVFDNDLPSDKYVVFATGYASGNLFTGRITSRTSTGAGCTVKFGDYNSVTTDADPTGLATLVFFGLTS